MVIKTRDRLIEVARKLFLNKGIENTTMIDIANASDNGRRTVYSYFKNKFEFRLRKIKLTINTVDKTNHNSNNTKKNSIDSKLIKRRNIQKKCNTKF